MVKPLEMLLYAISFVKICLHTVYFTPVNKHEQKCLFSSGYTLDFL